MRCASHGRVLKDATTRGVATVMGMNSLLGCETARRLTGAGPEETGKEHTQGSDGSDGFGQVTGFVSGTVGRG